MDVSFNHNTCESVHCCQVGGSVTVAGGVSADCASSDPGSTFCGCVCVRVCVLWSRFHLPSCLGEAILKEVTYLISSLSDIHREREREERIQAGLFFPPSVPFPVLSHLLHGFHTFSPVSSFSHYSRSFFS